MCQANDTYPNSCVVTLLLYNRDMEDDLQIIEKFESDEWKNYVKREIFAKTRLGIDLDFDIAKNRICHFRAFFAVNETTYTMTCSHDMYMMSRSGGKFITPHIIHYFANNINKKIEEKMIKEEISFDNRRFDLNMGFGEL